jgi:HK97 family phage portal protein
MAFWRNVFALRKSSKDLVNPPKRGFGFNSGVTVSEDSAMQISAFYRGVIYISSQIAKLPWEVKDRKNAIVEDSVSYLIGLSPNPEMNAMSLRLYLIQSAIIHGNGYAEIERDTLGRPVNLWPLPPSRVEPWRTPEGELVYKVLGGSFTGESVYLSYRDVFHIKNFHTKDGINGQGVVAYALQTLGISLGADRMAGNLFANGGLPSGVLELPGVLSDEAFERVKKSWEEAHTGRKSAGIAILEEGMKYSPAAMQPDVMQFLESRKFNVLEIARFLGLPPTKLFDIEASTYSNQEQSNLEVATDTLDSWCRSLEMEADIKLLNKRYGGKRTEFDLYEIFRGDMTTRSNYFSKMMQVAAMSPNEIRIREGMAPYADGDRFFVAVNNFSPADRIDEIIDSQVSKSEPESVEPEPNNSTQELLETERELAEAVKEYLRK